MPEVHEYAIVVEEAESGRNWCGYSPDLPGVIATDATAETTAERLRGAVAFTIWVMQEEGLDVRIPSAIASMVMVPA
jgi:predicted RNase H-like HicB family nuclease